jgi:SAM-dependent methyltransferase
VLIVLRSSLTVSRAQEQTAGKRAVIGRVFICAQPSWWNKMRSVKALPGRFLLKLCWHSLPLSWRRKISPVARSVTDYSRKRRLFGAKANLVPPLYLMEDGAVDYSEFKQNGLDAFSRLIAAGLKPSDRVLDIGSGIGRKTLPLVDYLTTGSYEGIDLVLKQVRWCSTKITPEYPNFRFHHVDLWSAHYNSRGAIKPSEYRFPFRDREFDFVILGSVFTHMFPADVEHYILEISRMLQAGARGWITFFLLNPESVRLIDAGKSSLSMLHNYECGSRADNPYRLETAISHQESLVLSLFAKYGIHAEIAEYGSWCGRRAAYYQDIVTVHI